LFQYKTKETRKKKKIVMMIDLRRGGDHGRNKQSNPSYYSTERNREIVFFASVFIVVFG